MDDLDLSDNEQTNGGGNSSEPPLREAVGPLPLILDGACHLLRLGARSHCLRRSTVNVGSERHPNWDVDRGGGLEAQDIGLSYGWGLLRLFPSCRKKKNKKGDKVNEDEGKSPLDDIYAAAGVVIKSAHLSSQCG